MNIYFVKVKTVLKAFEVLLEQLKERLKYLILFLVLKLNYLSYLSFLIVFEVKAIGSTT